MNKDYVTSTRSKELSTWMLLILADERARVLIHIYIHRFQSSVDTHTTIVRVLRERAFTSKLLYRKGAYKQTNSKLEVKSRSYRAQISFNVPLHERTRLKMNQTITNVWFALATAYISAEFIVRPPFVRLVYTHHNTNEERVPRNFEISLSHTRARTMRETAKLIKNARFQSTSFY